MGNHKSTTINASLLNLKISIKELEKNAKMCERRCNLENIKLKKAVAQGNMDGAKIYAENVIRNKNQALTFRRMASRIEAVTQRINSGISTKNITYSMNGVVNSMGRAMKTMNLEQISTLMDRFEQQFENLDVRINMTNDAMHSATHTSSPQNDVDLLMQQVADETGIELNGKLPDADNSSISNSISISLFKASHDQDELSKRLAKLRYH